MEMYTTARGRKTPFKPYGQLSAKERFKILSDWLKIGSKKARAKWNISTQTLGHLKWHCREIIEKIEDRNFRKAGL